MPDQIAEAAAADPSWKSLYRIGGAAALIAGIVFRRNLGVEIGLFSPVKPPGTAAGWFELLQAHRLLGLAYLNVFDLVNYFLVGLMFLALAAALWQASKSLTVLAAASAFLGVAVYFASNTALSLLALSDQWAAAASEAGRAQLEAAGQALLALNRFSSAGAHPGSGGYLSLLLVAAAGLVVSAAMLRSGLFGRAAAYIGLLANGLDLAYCIAFAFAPATGESLAVLFIPAAGLLFLVWHVLVGWGLFRLGRTERQFVPLAAQP